MLQTIIPYVRQVVLYALAAPQFVQVAWQTAKYFYNPLLAAAAGGVFVFCLAFRVFVGGIGGLFLRIVLYAGFYYFLFTNAQFRLLFVEPLPAAIIAAISVFALILPVAILGFVLRKIFGFGRSAPAPMPAQAAAPGGGQPFNVVRAENEKKQIMVIMMTDIVGYSAKMEKDEAATYALLKEHNTIVRRAITTNRGREIKTIGDAFMVVFEQPLDALRCGIVIQKELFKFNKPRPANDQLKIRIGIHRGEVIVTQKDVFGEGVNIAARMESITDPGGISISADVYEHVKNKVEAGFQSVGIPKMKNIANPPEVFKVHLNHG